jgi:hypothetical protein
MGIFLGDKKTPLNFTMKNSKMLLQKIVEKSASIYPIGCRSNSLQRTRHDELSI